MLCCLALSAQAKADPLQACLNFARQQNNSKLHLQKDCPALFKELKNQGLLAAFEPSLLDEVNLAQLEFLADSHHSLRESASIRQAGLDQLLATILITESKDNEAKWWQAFLNWLDSLKTGDHEVEYQWLLRFMEKIKPSEQTVRIFIYSSIALLAASAVWIVVSELYVAGFFAFGRSSMRQPLIRQRPVQKQTIPTPLQHLSELAPHRQIAVLLEQVIDALVERKIIPHDLSLTHRQIVRYIGEQNGDPAFAHLVYAAEPILYGNHPVDAYVLSHYRRDAQALLDSHVL